MNFSTLRYHLMLLALAGTLAACGGEPAQQPAQQAAQQQPAQQQSAQQQATQQAATQQQATPNNHVPVYTEQVQPGTFRHYVHIQGAVESDRTIRILPKATATVETIHVRSGRQVQAGDTLATLDGEVTRTQIEELKTRLDLARTVYERQQNLRRDDIGSEIELLRARNQVQSLESQLATLREQYDNYIITAPIGGTVNSVSLKVGETASPTAPAFQIANSEALKVTAELSESYISRIETTDSVTVTIPSIGYERTTVIDVVSRVIDPANRTFSIEIFLPGTDNSIRPNMMARLRINDITRPGTLTIPVNAVQSGNNSRFVYLAEQAGGDSAWTARRQPVVTGMSYNDRVVADSGITAGDLVITRGYGNVEEGDRITLQRQ
ncbi:MAG: efflux RND transporter periplasmic adaptor subunit [Balneolaceae bacterium]|nr:efflux RND transporter periplasmic adaptor subunit [Balneolaceae bacterium]